MEKTMKLKAFFERYPSVALGFSGGVDSSYLLYAGLRYGADVKPYFIKTAFQPEFELRDAQRLAGQLGANVTVLTRDILEVAEVRANPQDRCYYCKRALFGMLREQAIKDGYHVLIDGSNASDDAADRAGMRATKELKVLSPLREAGLTKAEIRHLSKEAGLFTHDKPAYACLATRIPTGREIDADTLKRVERAEDALFDLGFTDFRARVYGEAARLQFPQTQMIRAVEMRGAVREALSPYFEDVFLDLKGR